MEMYKRNKMIKSFLEALFDKDDAVSFTCINKKDSVTMPPVGQCINPFSTDLTKLLATFYNLNTKNKLDVFLCINPVKRSTQDFKERVETNDISEIRMIYLDWDNDKSNPPIAKVPTSELLVSLGLPRPTVIVQTSEEGYHVWFRLKAPVDKDIAQELIYAAQTLTNSDPAAVDPVCRLLRLPGYENHKPGRNNFTANITEASGHRPSVKDFDAAVNAYRLSKSPEREGESKAKDKAKVKFPVKIDVSLEDLVCEHPQFYKFSKGNATDGTNKSNTDYKYAIQMYKKNYSREEVMAQIKLARDTDPMPSEDKKFKGDRYDYLERTADNAFIEFINDEAVEL